MKKSRFTESQVVSLLKQVDTSAKVESVCRKRGMNDAVYYNWKTK